MLRSTAIPLRYSIPLLIVLLSAVLVTISIAVVIPTQQALTAQRLQQEAETAVRRLRSTLGYLLARNDAAGVRQAIRANAADKDLEKLLLIDGDNRVLFSAHLDEVGKRIDALPEIHFNPQLLTQARQDPTGASYFDPRDDTFYQLAPISLAGLGMADGDRGLLVIEYSGGLIRQASWRALGVLLGVFTVAIILAAALLIWLARRLLTARLQHLRDCAQAVAAGDLSRRCDLAGRDEIAELGAAFCHMADSIQVAHAALETDARLLAQLVDNSPSLIAMRDASGHYLRANPAYAQLFELGGPERIRTLSPLELFPAEVARQLLAEDRAILDEGGSLQGEVEVLREGRKHRIIYAKFPLLNAQDERYAVCIIGTDITDKLEQEKENRLARYIFDTTSDGIVVTDLDNRIIDVNPAFERVTGYARQEVIGQSPGILSSHRHPPAFYEQMWTALAEHGVWTGEVWNRKRSGEIYPEWLAIKTIVGASGEMSGYFGVLTDISEQKAVESKLKSLAYYDPLTKLANRTLFREQLEHDLLLANRHDESLAVLFIDLDFFKHVNDSLGHEFGDQLLIEVARRIGALVRETDTVARWGGDEFILALPAIFERNIAYVIASKILDTLKQPFDLDEHHIHIGASLGIALYPDDAATAQELIQYADAAMYKSKQAGRNQICFFDPSLNEKNLQLIRLKAAMHRALERQEFELFYQPKVAPASGEVIGLEALLRWESPEFGSVSPAEFIPAAEQGGLIIDIGDWVLQQVCRQLCAWGRRGLLEGRRVSVNLSPKQLRDPGLLSKVTTVLERNGVDASHIALEVTESDVIENMELVVPVLTALKRQGIAIELDDFGSGYSSLTYLSRLPVDVLKVDRSFVSGLEHSETNQSIVESVVRLAHALGLQVTAEGVETEGSLAIIEALGCAIVQGNYYAMPLSAAAAERLLAASQPFRRTAAAPG